MAEFKRKKEINKLNNIEKMYLSLVFDGAIEDNE